VLSSAAEGCSPQGQLTAHQESQELPGDLNQLDRRLRAEKKVEAGPIPGIQCLMILALKGGKRTSTVRKRSLFSLSGEEMC